MKKTLLAIVIFLSTGHFVFAQSDFTSIYAQRTLAKQHITQIRCYWFKNAAKPDEAVLTDSLVFNDKGLCLLRKTTSYTYSYVYNAKGTILQQITKGKNKSDSTITVFRYDKKGNLILSADIHRAADIKNAYPEYALHKFEYGNHNELLREYWVNVKGQQIQRQRYKYITVGLDPSVEKVVNFYDERDKLTFIKKYYKNYQVKDYSMDNGKLTFVAESFLNKKHDLDTFTDYYHLPEVGMRVIDLTGHPNLKRDTLTEVYKYTDMGFCSEKVLYIHNKQVESYKWYFK